MTFLFICFVIVMSMLESGNRILGGIAATVFLIWLFS
jgi:hypothetical protein